MPSRQSRVALTIPEDLRKTLGDVAEASGKPVSTFVVDLLQTMQPQLEAMAKLFRHAQAGRKSAALNVARGMLGDAVFQLHDSSQGMLPLAPAKKSARRR